MANYGPLTAYIAAHDAAAAIEFYKNAFGAKERYRIDMDGRIGHAELEIGAGVLYLSDEFADHDALSPKTLGGAGCAFVLETDDIDAGWQRAVEAGATVTRPISDAPFGRGGWLKDPFGFRWNLMQPNPNFNPADMGATVA
jgi:PhnB protein